MLQRATTRTRRRSRAVALLLALTAGACVAAYAGVAGGTQAPAAHHVTRTYYIAADEVAWDYAPSGINEISGEPFGEQENVFVEQGPDRIGKVYLKALYREYTDATFTTLKRRPAAWQHLGTLGPLIRAEVGDTIVVHFKNNARFPFSVHPHGVFYEKDSEGAAYNDGTSADEKADNA